MELIVVVFFQKT